MDTLVKLKRNKNPVQKTNVFSLLTFGYLVGLFKKAYKKDLEEEDIYEILKCCESKRCGNKSEKLWQKTPSLLIVLIFQFGLQYLFISMIDIAWTIVSSVLSPLGLSKVVAYFIPNQTAISTDQVYKYAGILVFVKFAKFMVAGNLRAWEEILGVRIEAAMKSLLYRKSLKLSPADSEASLGNIVTLITKDIHILERNMWIVKDFVLFFIEFGTVASLLYLKIGKFTFVGLGVFVIVVVIQVYLSYKLKNLRLAVGKYSDERLQRTQETLSTMKIIKMYTWENFFNNRISESRRKEINNLLEVFMIDIFIDTLGAIVSQISFLFLIKIYVWMGYQTSVELIFYILQLFNQLSHTFGSTLPKNFSKVAQFCACVKRLDDVFNGEEMEKFASERTPKPTVSLSSVCFNAGNKQILKDISMDISRPGLVVVTGSVGSGKSSLLKVILKDYQPINRGYIEIKGTISYASQDPWIFPATLRQNILFSGKYDKTRFEEVLRVCALEYDLSLLDQGDQTILSDRGQNLSKGQQARINLARAIYRDTNIYLLDDSLTALDSRVQDYIFNECILSFLKDKIVILVSQNPLHINQADQVLVLNEGTMMFESKYQQIEADDYEKDLKDPDIKESDITEKTGSDIVKRKFSQVEQNQRRVSVYREVKKKGKVDLNTYQKYFQYGGGFTVFVLILMIYVGSQFADSYGDKLTTKWVDYQQRVLDLENNNITSGAAFDLAVYYRDYVFTVVGILTLVRCVLHIAKYFALLWFCRTASINLHNKMILGITGATMAFFDTHFIGNILNRLSYDLNNIDESIPFQFPGLSNVIFHTLGSVVLITTVNWFFMIPVAVFMVLMVLLRMAAMPALRSLKRLGASTRSPLVGHINSSLEGLTTVRAFNAEQKLRDEFDKHQDLYSSASIMMRLSTLGFTFYMDFMSALFSIVVIGRFLFFHHDSSAGNVGLALTQVFKLTSYVQLAIRRWTFIENNMVSVERAIEYTALKQEQREGKEISNWPNDGAMKFENISLRYEGCKTPVLKSLNFEVKSRQKIGIVGRTGAGKSTIINVLYRLAQFEGTVTIDGIDTKIVSLEFLRKNISIIPQDPILFAGTIRENLDPLQLFTDDEIWHIIHRVGISEIVPSLDTIVEEKGSSFSSGQKQMICLARAALSKSKILVLDEATANMDAGSDKHLHEVVEDVFVDCTILMIAHRLHLILNCDKVLVLDKGNIVEFDDPKSLLKEEDSMFHKMCQESKMD